MSVEGDDSFATARSSPGDYPVVPDSITDKLIYNVMDEDSEMKDHDVKGRRGGSLVIDIAGGLTDCRAELAQVRLELDSAKSEMASLLKDHEACRADLTQKQCALDDAKSEAVSLSRDLEILQQRCQAEQRDSEALIVLLREELEECRSKFEEDKSNLQNAIVKLQMEFQDKQRYSAVRIESLTRELQDCRSNLKEAESNLEDTVRARTAQYYKELEDCKAEKNRVEGDLAETHVKLQISECALDDAKSKVMSLSRDLEALQQRCQAERRDSQDLIVLLREELEECRSKFEEDKTNLQNAIVKLQMEFQDKQRYSSVRIESLTRELEDCRSNLKEAEYNLEDTVRVLTAQYYKELEDCKAEKNQAEGDLSEAHVKLKVLEDQRKSSDDRVASLSKDLLECQARLNKMENKEKDARAVKNPGRFRVEIRI